MLRISDAKDTTSAIMSIVGVRFRLRYRFDHGFAFMAILPRMSVGGISLLDTT